MPIEASTVDFLWAGAFFIVHSVESGGWGGLWCQGFAFRSPTSLSTIPILFAIFFLIFIVVRKPHSCLQSSPQHVCPTAPCLPNFRSKEPEWGSADCWRFLAPPPPAPSKKLSSCVILSSDCHQRGCLTQFFFFFFLESASLPLPMLEWLVALLILETLSEECCLRMRRSSNRQRVSGSLTISV